MPRTVDLNSDMGESFGSHSIGADAGVIRSITSANLACGFHGGDARVIRQSVALCKTHNVAIGAHPGLPDLQGFGRRRMAVTPAEARDFVAYQIGAMNAFVHAAGLKMQHVKPHGALYMMGLEDDALSDAMVEAVAQFNDKLFIYTTAGTATERACTRRGLPAVREFFADRPMSDAGWVMFGSQLAEVAPSNPTDAAPSNPTDPAAPKPADAAYPRLPGDQPPEPPSSADATLHEALAARAVRAVVEGKVITTTGRDTPLAVDTVCVHSDTPGSPEILAAIRRAMTAAGISALPPQ